MGQRETSGAAIGWTMFAAWVLILLGIWDAFAGLVALINDEFYVVTREYVVQFDATTWGWIKLIWGVVMVLAGLSLFSGAVWARTVGVIVALISAIVNFMWLPWYPIWAIIIIAVDVAVIWALTAHGRDITRA